MGQSPRHRRRPRATLRRGFVRKSRENPLPYKPRGPLLSRGELAFFRALLAAVAGEHVVALKVRVADLIICSDKAWDAGFGHMIARHHIDFVLCDRRSMIPIAAIELDDRSHDSPRRRKRDRFLNDAFAAAGIPLVRFRAAARYDAQEIHDVLAAAIETKFVPYVPKRRG